MLPFLVLIYGFIYVIIQLEKYSLLVGSLGLFMALGITMYVTCQIGEVGVEDYTRAIMPFLGAAVLLVILVIHFPQLAVWIPNLLIGVPR